MFKRAYLYACTAPVLVAKDIESDSQDAPTQIAENDKDVESKINTKRRISEEPAENSEHVDEDSEADLIQWMPGGKVAKCKYCPDKAMLNQDAVVKHLDSKAHKRAQKREIARKKQAEEIRSTFMKRMDEVEKKAIETIRHKR